MKLTTQEQNITNFLSSKKEAYWEELAQFAKEPSKVKLKTIQKAVSDIRKKFKDAHLKCPFECKLASFETSKTVTQTNALFQAAEEAISFNGQKLVKVVRPPTQVDTRKPHQIDFTLRKYQWQVITKTGIHTLSEDDFAVFEYFYDNAEKVISLEELRDRVVFPLFGSKLPARWFSAIQRRINNLRRAVPELKNRILTMKLDNTTGYFFR
jgi:hypothetical protein